MTARTETPQAAEIPAVPIPVTVESADDASDSKAKETWTENTVEHSDPLDSQEQKRVLRRIDVLVLPIMTLFLAFCFIDRSNMGLAAVAGMAAELKLVGFQYSTTLLLFFPGYVIFALPSNYMLSKMSVRLWLCTLGLGFGLFTMVMGFTQNFGSLGALRFLLGSFEAGVLPAVVVIVSSWYPRYQLGRRFALIYCGANLASAFAGILAYAFSRINVGSYRGWRWIFILEGILTIVITVIAYFVIDEYPQNSRFLTPEQRATAVELINRDRNEQGEEKMTLKVVFESMRDIKIWIYGFLYMFSASAIYSISYFMPLILNQRMGFSGAMSQVLSTPPSVYAFIVGTVLTYVSDRCQRRSPFILFFALNIIVGNILTRWGPNTGSQYLGLFITLSGLQGGLATIISFAQNNAPTRVKRGVSSGIQLSCGAMGGIIGSTIFRSQDAPYYTPGIATTIGMIVVQIILVIGLTAHLARENKKQETEGKILEGQPGFRYTL